MSRDTIYKHAERNAGRHDSVDDFEPASASCPTSTRPGTKERLRQMIARAEAGEELWHEDDATCLGSDIEEWHCSPHAMTPLGDDLLAKQAREREALAAKSDD